MPYYGLSLICAFRDRRAIKPGTVKKSVTLLILALRRNGYA